MKVLHVIPSLSTAHGGPSTALHAMERALAERRVTVETATTDDDGPGRRVKVSLAGAVQEDGIVRWYFAKRTELYKCAWSFGPWLAAHVRNYDLLHIHALFSFMSTAAARAARRAGVPYIVRPLGVLNDYGMRQRRPLLKRLSVAFIEGPILRHAAAVHFTSEAERLEAETLRVPMRAAVIPLALTTGAEASSASLASFMPAHIGKRVVLFLSRLDPKKNVEALLAAFAQVLPSQPRAVLIVAGSGEATYLTDLKRMAQDLGIGNRVAWPGYVEGERKAALMREAAVFVLPSHSENFGIAVLEALACGTPSIVGSGVALAEAIKQHNAGRVVGTDAASIATGLRELLESENLRAECGRNARKLALTEFSSAAMGQRLKTLYEQVLAERR